MPLHRPDRGVLRHFWRVTLAGTVLVSGATAASAQVTVGPAEYTGRWSLPFEEGGVDSPTCAETDDGNLQCKPVAQAMGVLPDGRVFYYSGLEGQENFSPATGTSAMKDSPARLLDLRSGTPEWSVPTNPTGGGANPDAGSADGDPAATLTGVAGVPGRPGDGPVGSVWGAVGGPETNPSAAPDDANDNDGDMFCGDIANMADGRLLITGGGDWYDEPGVATPAEGDGSVGTGLPEVEGLRSARIFDPATSSFTPAGDMRFHRWYPATVTLPDGKILAAGGATKRVKNTQGGNVRRTETFDPATGQWTENFTGPASETSLPLSPRLHLLPSGKVFYPGAGHNWAPFGTAADEALYGMMQYYDPQSKHWEFIRPHLAGARDGAASVLMPLDPPYDRSYVLTFGGTMGSPPGSGVATPLSILTRIDSHGNIAEEQTRFTMLEPRWNPSAVVLPDGSVLAVGGATSSDTTAPGTALPVRTVELFDIRTEQWYSMARINRDRTYHHSAMLLPDGRVLLGGHAPTPNPARNGDLGGGPLPNSDRDPSFEIFTPHYLFRGGRPVIRHVQAGIGWGKEFILESRQALQTDSVVLVRLGSPQHIIDSDQRVIRLEYRRHSGRLAVKAPPNGAVAPPGYYYLFLNLQTRRGPIPSVARIVKVGLEEDMAEAPQPFPDNPTDSSPGEANEDGDSSAVAPIEEGLSSLVGVDGASGVLDSAAPRPGAESLAAVPAGAARRNPLSPGLPAAAVAVTGVAALTGRRWLRRR